MVLPKKTICRVDVVGNNRLITHRILHIPTYHHFTDWQAKAHERIKYVDSKIAEIMVEQEISGRDYEVFVYVMSNG